jgi:hypothetical protein
MTDNHTPGSDPQSEEAFSLLWEGLREAKRRFRTGQDTGRGGAIHALETVVKFLGLFDPVRREALHAPLARLFDDLMSLDDGKISAMLAPKKKSGRARASGFYDGMKGLAVFTVRRLAATGMTFPDARRMVAAALAEAGFRPARKGSAEGAGEFRGRTLRKWQEDIGANETATNALRLLETAHVTEVLSHFGLPTLPAGFTVDNLLLQHCSPAELQHAYIVKMAAFIANTRGQETT